MNTITMEQEHCYYGIQELLIRNKNTIYLET